MDTNENSVDCTPDDAAGGHSLHRLVRSLEPDFAAVREAAEQACADAIKQNLDCCANFDDLHCHEVQWCLRDDGDHWWLVDLEEASPDDHALQCFVRDGLAEKGFAVEVRTAW